jgi:diaminohydroxyphosphoribosylaminopyrimidine deaminase/5-amino-6-(5-phosphoribosylamino)uracil reductase
VENGLQYFLLNKEFNIIHQLMVALYKLNIQSVLVEGGAKLLQSFIDEGIWDEVRVITNQQLKLNREGEKSNGLAAPSLKNAMPGKIMKLHGDLVEIFKPDEN